MADHGVPPSPNVVFTAQNCPPAKTLSLAETPTRLKAMDTARQERLINWGYAICDVAMRRHGGSQASPPGRFPYPDTGLA